MNIPLGLEKIRDDFISVPESERLNLLLYFSESLPKLPGHLSDLPKQEVPECQSPLAFFVEIEAGQIFLHAYAPEQAPTTRGFASILVHGTQGVKVEEFLGIPNDFPSSLGLTKLVSPLRLRGMSAFIIRAKRALEHGRTHK